jgi:hypothetical protein
MPTRPQPLLGPNGSVVGARKAPRYESGPNPIKERYVDYDTGHHILYTQNCDNIVAGVAEQSDIRPKHARGASTQYLGSAPLLVCQIWAKESGTRVGTREFTEYARGKLMSGDYSKFKAFLQ